MLNIKSVANTGWVKLCQYMLFFKRYELPAPPAGRMNDVSAWIESVDNAQAQLEHQSLRYNT